MKIIVNPKFENYKPLITKIINNDVEIKHVYCNNRNKVYSVDAGDKTFVVKQFNKMTWANRFIYNYLRKSKAQRSYENAVKLTKNKIFTPTPVAYIDNSKHGLYYNGFYISELLNWQNISEHSKNLESNQQKIELGKQFIDFTYQLHEKKIVHHDYNTGNILVNNNNGKYQFALVDINRMTFNRKPNIKESMKCFSQLGLPLNVLEFAINNYSPKRGFDIEESVFYTLLANFKKRKAKQFTNALKSLF